MKQILVTVIVGLILSNTSVGLAAPLAISGQTILKHQITHTDEPSNETGTMYTFTLRGEQPLNKTTSLFARFAAQYASNRQLADYDFTLNGEERKLVAQIDQYGLLYQTDKRRFLLGRQEAIIGKTALLYSRSETNVGYGKFVDGLSGSVTVNRFEFSGLAARENNLVLANNSLYSLRAGYNFEKTANAGITWGRYQPHDADSSQHWALDATFTTGKISWFGEYTFSSASDANKAFVVGFNYDFDGKTALYVKNFRVEANGDMGGQSDFDNNNRGFHYGLTHAFNDKLSLEIIYKDQCSLDDNRKNNTWEFWLTQKF